MDRGRVGETSGWVTRASHLACHLRLSRCHTLPCIRRPLDDGLCESLGHLFLVTVSYNLRVCLCLPSTLSCYVARRRPQGSTHTHTLCVVCVSHFMEEALGALHLASRAGFDTVVSEPSCVKIASSLQRGVCEHAGTERGPAWLRNASRLDACVA